MTNVDETTATAGEVDVDYFRARLRTWLAENMPRVRDDDHAIASHTDEAEIADWQRSRELQRKLWDGGFAGIIFPKSCGGLGLTIAHQQAFNEEIAGYEFPARLQVPTIQPCATVLLEFGTPEQLRRHIPPILKGDAVWMQFLSEPSGGSDVAGALTTAVRDGDEWILNGSKIWTSSAWLGDWALCLARTNWDVPKHRGLTVFTFPISQPGIEIQRIEMLNGSREFCQEFITDLRVPDSDRIGDVDDGWTVGRRWMYYEHSFSISFHTTRPPKSTRTSVEVAQDAGVDLVRLAKRTGHTDDVTRERIGEAHALSLTGVEAYKRIERSIRLGRMPGDASNLTKVLGGTLGARVNDITFELTGAGSVAWSDDEEDLGSRGIDYLIRQKRQIGGGTTEMARNVVSERVLGMPRERTNDRDVAFRSVPRGPEREGS